MTDKERYHRYLASREWGLLREAVRRRCGNLCERCRLHPMSHVHHLTYIRKYNERLDNLQGLCEGCHEYTHGKSDHDPARPAPAVVQSIPTVPPPAPPPWPSRDWSAAPSCGPLVPLSDVFVMP